MVYLVVRLLGVPEEIVPYNYCTGVEGVTATDAAFAVFRYPRALARCRAVSPTKGGSCGAVLPCTAKRVRRRSVPWKSISTIPRISLRTTEYAAMDGWNGAGRICDSETFDRYADMMKDFADMIAGKRKQTVSLETEAQVA